MFHKTFKIFVRNLHHRSCFETKNQIYVKKTKKDGGEEIIQKMEKIFGSQSAFNSEKGHSGKMPADEKSLEVDCLKKFSKARNNNKEKL